jgi:hypothetical protein
MAKMEQACTICGSDLEHTPRECIGKMIQEGVRAELRRAVDIVKKQFPVKSAIVLSHPEWGKVIKKILGE